MGSNSTISGEGVDSRGKGAPRRVVRFQNGQFSSRCVAVKKISDSRETSRGPSVTASRVS